MTWQDTIDELDALNEKFKLLLLPKVENQDQAALNILRARCIELHYLRYQILWQLVKAH